METTKLLEHFGTKTAIATFFGIKPAAVSQWGDRVPKLRVYELRERLPELFRQPEPAHDR